MRLRGFLQIPQPLLALNGRGTWKPVPLSSEVLDFSYIYMVFLIQALPIHTRMICVEACVLFGSAWNECITKPRLTAESKFTEQAVYSYIGYTESQWNRLIDYRNTCYRYLPMLHVGLVILSVENKTFGSNLQPQCDIFRQAAKLTSRDSNYDDSNKGSTVHVVLSQSNKPTAKRPCKKYSHLSEARELNSCRAR